MLFTLLLTIKLIGALALTYAFQQVYASHDMLAIFRNEALKKKTNLNHTSRHAIRIAYVVLLASLAFQGWIILPGAAVLFSFFFLGFDPTLNRLRNKTRFYMGPSNAHDKFFLSLRDKWPFNKFPKKINSQNYYIGRFMYRVELIGLVLGITVFYLTAYFTH